MRSLLLFGNNFSRKGSSIYLISSQITSLGLYYAKYFGGGGRGVGMGMTSTGKKENIKV